MSLRVITIKAALGKITVADGYVQSLVGAGARMLPISAEHAAAVGALPHHHGDPFDRILIAQAIAENATLVTRDLALSAYHLAILW